MTSATHLVLTVMCPGRVGLVAAISGFLSGRGCFINEMSQFDDVETGLFFARLEFLPPADESLESLRDAFVAVQQGFKMTVSWSDKSQPMRTLLLVSQHDHCLLDLLQRKQRGELNVEFTKVLSNHSVCQPIAEFYGVEFELLPQGDDPVQTKAAREQRILEVMQETQSDLVVLARYMQILTEDLCQELAGRCINIHHSFLPGFKGARPYYQAYDRGVKQIGATAHYVTSDLDEGPIIEQEVTRVNHTHSPDDLRDAGRSMETQALAKAVKYHSEHRLFVNGLKTVVLN